MTGEGTDRGCDGGGVGGFIDVAAPVRYSSPSSKDEVDRRLNMNELGRGDILCLVPGSCSSAVNFTVMVYSGKRL